MSALEKVGEAIINLFLTDFWQIKEGKNYYTECPLCSWDEREQEHDEECPIPAAIEEYNKPKPINFSVGSKVKIKQSAWENFSKRYNLPFCTPLIQTIISMPRHPPYHNKIMLSYPLMWWDEDDIELCEK